MEDQTKDQIAAVFLHHVSEGTATPEMERQLLDWLSSRTTARLSSEEAVIATFNAAKQSHRLAEEALGEYFWPIVRAAKTAEEARSIMDRVPSSVIRTFFVDHFVYVSKVLPPIA